MFFLKKLLVFVLFIFTVSKSYSQAFYRYRFEEPWSIALSSGATQYFGDLYSFWQYRDRPQLNPNALLSIRRTVGTNLKGRLDLGYYEISGDDKYANPKSYRTPRNLHFKAKNIEASVIGEYYLKPVKLYNITRNFLNIYAFAGVGATTNNPKAELDGSWVPLRPLQLENEKYKKVVLTFPTGLGIKYKVNVYTDLQLEFNYRWTLTDYLDDISIYNIASVYQEAINQYTGISGGNYQPERLRLLVRNPQYILSNGEPNISKIQASNGRIRRGSGIEGRDDGYLSINLGVEIYFSQDVWDNWILRKRKNRSYIRFW